jgi:uncharacterized membrane protein
MNRTARRLALIVAVGAVIVGVAVACYIFGSNAGHAGQGPMMGYRGFRGPGMMNWDGGFAWWPPAFMIFVGIVVLAVLLIPGQGVWRSPSVPGSIDQLARLSEMHDKGALSDEEFTAAKRKLLGL